MRVYLSLITGLTALVLLFSGVFSPTSAQTQCTALIQETIATLESSCGDAGGNSICFGTAASATGPADVVPVAAGDVLSLADVETVQTPGLNTETNEWGFALLNVHANVPLASSSEGLRFLMIGDVRLENAVAPDTAFVPVEAITITSIVGANIRSVPSTDGRVLTNAPVGTELMADGLSADGAWLRILSTAGNAWISRQVITVTEGDINSLPTITGDTQSLMQSFYLHTGNDALTCSDAPPAMLIIQAPIEITGLIWANGVEIRFDGTIMLRTQPDNTLVLVVIRGGATSGGVSVPEGFTMSIQLDENSRDVVGLWTGLRPINDGERAALVTIEGIPQTVLHNSFTIPTVAEVAAIQASINQAAAGQTVSGPAAGRVNCSGFRPTSPLDAVATGGSPFFWDRADGATAYRLNIYDPNGAALASYDLPANNTTFSVDVGGFGGAVAWEVQAFADGELACTTARINVAVVAGAQPVGSGDGGPPSTPTACPWASC